MNAKAEAVQEEVKEDPVVTKARAAFSAGVKGNKDEDAIKMAMIQAGASFKNVTRLYNQFAQEAGLVMSKEERDKIINDTCSKAKATLNTEDGLNTVIDTLVGTVKGSNESAISRMVRAWCKANDVEVFTKPKGTGQRKGFRTDFYNELRKNPKMTEDQVKAYTKEHGTENENRNVKFHLDVAKLCNDIVAAK